MTTATLGDRSGTTYSGSEDAVLYSGLPDTNFSSENSTQYAILRFPGLSSITGPVTVSDAYLNLKITSGGSGSGSITVKRVLRNWVEAQATYNSYSSGNAWTTPGAGGSGTDVAAGNSCVVSYPGFFDTSDIASTSNTQLITDIQNILDGTATNNGWVIDSSSLAIDWGLPANATAASRPMLTVVYSAASSVDPGIITGSATTFGMPGFYLG